MVASETDGAVNATTATVLTATEESGSGHVNGEEGCGGREGGHGCDMDDGVESGHGRQGEDEWGRPTSYSRLDPNLLVGRGVTGLGWDDKVRSLLRGEVRGPFSGWDKLELGLERVRNWGTGGEGACASP